MATKVAGWGEFVFAEYTQTFDCGETTYFFPLMQQVEVRLGRRPRFGALDKGFDAFYVYQYFQEAGGFAAVPWADRPATASAFAPMDCPCAGAIANAAQVRLHAAQPLYFPHQCARYVCPLRHPTATGESCPINHNNWQKGGCITTLPTGSGTRARHELDRASVLYKAVYRQRSATERINSLAVELGIEQTSLRNRQSITNLNTLLYVLLNLHALQRVLEKKRSGEAQPSKRLARPP